MASYRERNVEKAALLLITARQKRHRKMASRAGPPCGLGVKKVARQLAVSTRIYTKQVGLMTKKRSRARAYSTRLVLSHAG